MTTYSIKRTPAARDDLLSIARYTHDTWGEKQLRQYMAELDKTIQQLATSPQSKGQDRGNIRDGLRSVSHGDHYFVFYRVRGDTVEILRILHQRRNWQKMMATRRLR